MSPRTRRDVQQGTPRAEALRAAAGAPRGLAMMLVLIALSVATVVTAATLTARSMSPRVAENAQVSAAARWAAESGAQVAMAMLETELDWEALAGALATDLPVAGGSVTITLTNMEGAPPTSDDRDLIVTVVATVDGITSTSQRLVYVTPSGSVEDALDPHLGEFAVYSRGGLVIDDGARIAPWRISPEGAASKEVRIGLSAKSAADVQVSANASLASPKVYFDATASMLAVNALPDSMAYATLPIALPLINPTRPSTTLLAVRSLSDMTYTGAGVVTLQGGRYKRIEIGKNSEITLCDDTGGLYQFESIDLNMGTLVIDGHVKAVVTDDFFVDGGAMSFREGSTLELYVADQAVFRSYAGWEYGAAGDPDVDAEMYVSPRSFVICTTTSTSTVEIGIGSVVCAEIHAPQGTVTLHANSKLYGRISAADIEIRDGAVLYYDPGLDNRLGFTDLAGPLYKEDGTPIEGLEEAIAGYTGTLDDYATTVTTAITDLLEGAGGLLEDLLGGGGEEIDLSTRTAARITVKPIPTSALVYEKGSMFNGTVAYTDTSDATVTLVALGRPAPTVDDEPVDGGGGGKVVEVGDQMTAEFN